MQYSSKDKPTTSDAATMSRFHSALKYALCALVTYVFLYGAYFYYTVYDGNVVGEDTFGSNEKYTMRINTFRRNEDLKKIIRHYVNCPNIDAIQIVWSDLENKPPPLKFFELDINNEVSVLFEMQHRDSLNNRFNALLPIGTETVYSTDDDVIISCKDMTLGFKIWLNSRAPMVGFSRRLHGRDPMSGKHHYFYKEHVHVRGAYSMVLTKNSFFHKSLLGMYMSPHLVPLHNYIDKHRNCEDLLMSFVAANSTRRPSIYMYAPVQDLGKRNGISTGSSHKGIRDHCLDRFISFFGYDPLITTTYEAKPVDQHLLKLPGFWI